MSALDSCPFCQLQTEKARTVRDSKHSVVILSNPRLTAGHTLVVPKRHIEQPWELTDEELLDIFEQIKFVQSKLLASIATGFDIRQNYRPFMKQGRIKIDHVHFHILPRTFEDELYQKSMKHETELFLELGNREREKVLGLFQ